MSATNISLRVTIFLFVDFYVLAIGPVVEHADFDRYWTSGSSYPARDVLPPVGRESISVLAGSRQGSRVLIMAEIFKVIGARRSPEGAQKCRHLYHPLPQP